MNQHRHWIGLAAALLAGDTASAQWNSDAAANTPVCAQSGDQAVPRAAATGDGATWIAWFDRRSGSNYDVYVQLFDRDGVARLTPGGLLVSSQTQNSSLVDWDVLAHSSGACVLTFTDVRAGGDLDVYAYRIEPNGTFAWGPNGVTLSNNADFEANPKAAELADGSVVFVWPLLPNSGTGSIRAQILDSAGAPQLGGGADIALATGTASGEKPAFCDVVGAADGGFIVQWLRNTAVFTSPRHVKAQKYDASGVAQWNGGAPTSVYDAASVPIAHQPILESDGGNGAVLCWHSSGALFDSYVQKLDPNGAEVFAHNGMRVSLQASRHKLDPALAYLPASGDMIVVFDTRDPAQSNRGVSVQRISAAGARMWTDDGVELEPVDSVTEGHERIAAFGDGALITYFQYPTFGNLASNVIARRIDGTGADVWTSTTTLCSNLAPKDKPRLMFDGSGIGRLVWDDERSDSGDIYAQNVNVDGAIGPVTTCTAANYCISAPNTAGAGATIGWNGSTSLALNDFELTAQGCPPAANGLFFYGSTATAPTPFAAGFKCVANPVFRNLVVTTNGGGAASYALDLVSPLNPLGQITSGSTWCFQFWYRDPAGGGGPTNTTDALRADFCD